MPCRETAAVCSVDYMEIICGGRRSAECTVNMGGGGHRAECTVNRGGGAQCC